MVTRLQFSLPPALCAGKCVLHKSGVSGDRRAGCRRGGTSPPQAERERERVLTAMLEGAQERSAGMGEADKQLLAWASRVSWHS